MNCERNPNQGQLEEERGGREGEVELAFQNLGGQTSSEPELLL